MKFNLGFLGLYNMIIISLEIEYFEYYYLFPLLKEILNYQGYTLKLKYFKNLTQQTVKNTSQLTKWIVFFYKYYNTIYFNNFLFRKNLKKNEKYKFCFQLEKKNYIEKNITNPSCLLTKTIYYLYKEKKRYKKKKENQHIDNIKTKELAKISLFFSNHLKKNKINKIEKKYFFFKLILYYKKWKADEFYMKMAHIAYCENLIEFSIALFKMARFEKQTFFFLISILKI